MDQKTTLSSYLKLTSGQRELEAMPIFISTKSKSAPKYKKLKTKAGNDWRSHYRNLSVANVSNAKIIEIIQHLKIILGSGNPFNS